MREKRSYTVAAANLTGFASNATGAAFTLAANTAGDGLAHKVTIKNDSITDHSGKTITITGYDANGAAISETVTGPAGSATVTSSKYFWSVSSVTPSATIGADTFDIGWAAGALSPWLATGWDADSLRVAVQAGGTINYDLEHTPDYTFPVDAVAIKDASGSTASGEVVYTAPVAGVRVLVNSHTSGTFSLFALSGAR